VHSGGAADRQRQLRVLPDAENCRSRKRRGSRSTSIPTARTPSSTDQDASAAATRKAGSRTMALSNAPPNSAPWRACGNVDNAAALSTVPQENRTRRSGQMMCYQKTGQLHSLSTEIVVPAIAFRPPESESTSLRRATSRLPIADRRRPLSAAPRNLCSHQVNRMSRSAASSAP
jgi:hypothetical protein